MRGQNSGNEKTKTADKVKSRRKNAVKSVKHKTKSFLSASSSGYIAILLACFLPIILLGIRYTENFFRKKKADLLTADDDSVQKRCARDAALAVARNWNPGLTLDQQKDAIYKVADAIYNANPLYPNSVLGRAFPGLVTHNKDGKILLMDASLKQIEYEKKTKYVGQWYAYKYMQNNLWNPHYVLWLAADKASDSEKRISAFDEVDEEELNENGNYVLKHHEIFTSSAVYNTYIPDKYPTNAHYGEDPTALWYYAYSKNENDADAYALQFNLRKYTSITRAGSNNLKRSYYKSRIKPKDKNINVNISLKKDVFRVQTDKQVAYASPAKCNVDIILAIPVNGAACNVNNRDAASDISEEPLYHNRADGINDEVKQTPIYQMGQACKNFVKDNFYHTHGVNMALIPYSGKLSISPDRAQAWTVSFPKFIDVSVDAQKMIGACLYATSGEKNATLAQTYKTEALESRDILPTNDTPYYWGGVLTGCPIMCRKGKYQQSEYAGNKWVSGDILSNEVPNQDEYRYLRMNLNPCYMGYANMLAMRCERSCTHFLPNPYYVIELTADLVKIYEMCNALYPFYDTNNVSNFVFLPFEWANNLLQSWTKDPITSLSKDTSHASVLSCESKTAEGRKKALVVLVNKPNWFEAGELTYIGFNNDISEIPTVESDKIDFCINYSDSSKKFLDDAYYDGTIAGPKKILKFFGNVTKENSGYYEANGNNIDCGFTFPHKCAFKLVVEPAGNFNNSKSEVKSETPWIVSSNIDLLDNSSVEARKTYFIEPHQLTEKDADGNYYVSLKVRDIRFISAEVSNREYEEITPKCVFQGATNTIGDSGIAYIMTNVKQKVTIRAKTYKEDGRIVFYSDNIGKLCDVRKADANRTKIDLDLPYTIKDKQTFIFAGGDAPMNNSSINRFRSSGINFGHNLSVYKVRYSIENAEIVSCSLKNQLLRDYCGMYGQSGPTKDLILSNGMVARKGNKAYTPVDTFGLSYMQQMYNLSVNNALQLFRDSCIVDVDKTYPTYYENAYVGYYLPSQHHTMDIYGVTGHCKIYADGCSGLKFGIYDQSTEYSRLKMSLTNRWNELSFNCDSYFSDKVRMRVGDGASYLWTTLIASGEDKGFISEISNIDLRYNRGVGLQKLLFSIESISAGDWICFQGDGELAVTVKPKAHVGSIDYVRESDKAIATQQVTTDSDGYTTITIDPSVYYYEKTPYGYKVTLNLKDVVIDTSYGNNGVQFVDAPEKIYDFKKILSNRENTRSVNYRGSSEIDYASSKLSGEFDALYDSENESWKISSLSQKNQILKISPREISGDISHVMNDCGDCPTFMRLCFRDCDSDYYMSGLTRIFAPFLRKTSSEVSRNSSYNFLSCEEKSGENSTSIGGIAELLATEITYPMNAVLYSGGWQTNAETSSNEAVDKATQAVCQKLMADYGHDIRIYLVKYRHQKRYLSFPFEGVRQDVLHHDYSAIEACASTGHVYEATNESDLKQILDNIAADIKEWAGYKEAAIVNIDAKKGKKGEKSKESEKSEESNKDEKKGDSNLDKK